MKTVKEQLAFFADEIEVDGQFYEVNGEITCEWERPDRSVGILGGWAPLEDEFLVWNVTNENGEQSAFGSLPTTMQEQLINTVAKWVSENLDSLESQANDKLEPAE